MTKPPRWAKSISKMIWGIYLHIAASIAMPAKISGADLMLGKAVEIEFSHLSQPGQIATAVIFLSAKCPCSSSHEVILNQLSSQFKNIRFVGVHSNADESAEIAQSHFQKSQILFPIIQDDHAKIADEFHAFKTPHVFVINHSGEILYEGGVTDSHNAPEAKHAYLKEALQEVSLGKKPTRSEGRTLGCVIQR